MRQESCVLLLGRLLSWSFCHQVHFLLSLQVGGMRLQANLCVKNALLAIPPAAPFPPPFAQPITAPQCSLSGILLLLPGSPADSHFCFTFPSSHSLVPLTLWLPSPFDSPHFPHLLSFPLSVGHGSSTLVVPFICLSDV